MYVTIALIKSSHLASRQTKTMANPSVPNWQCFSAEFLWWFSPRPKIRWCLWTVLLNLQSIHKSVYPKLLVGFWWQRAWEDNTETTLKPTKYLSVCRCQTISLQALMPKKIQHNTTNEATLKMAEAFEKKFAKVFSWRQCRMQPTVTNCFLLH